MTTTVFHPPHRRPIPMSGRAPVPRRRRFIRSWYSPHQLRCLEVLCSALSPLWSFIAHFFSCFCSICGIVYMVFRLFISTSYSTLVALHRCTATVCLCTRSPATTSTVPSSTTRVPKLGLQYITGGAMAKIRSFSFHVSPPTTS
ncbi:hypothetical protein SEVIR_2G371000v4 [Setaria viridis]|uniref:Uncharacterized protein n=1 Tax=Setaria viridis TaxID=4556 RepID=A0A4U6VZD4_SETVI|nr:hypothetical protein SEVIR_2G371000v2 [Setaria viridis]